MGKNANYYLLFRQALENPSLAGLPIQGIPLEWQQPPYGLPGLCALWLYAFGGPVPDETVMIKAYNIESQMMQRLFDGSVAYIPKQDQPVMEETPRTAKVRVKVRPKGKIPINQPDVAPKVQPVEPAQPVKEETPAPAMAAAAIPEPDIPTVPTWEFPKEPVPTNEANSTKQQTAPSNSRPPSPINFALANLLGFASGYTFYMVTVYLISSFFSYIAQFPLLSNLLYWPSDVFSVAFITINTMPLMIAISVSYYFCIPTHANRRYGLTAYGISMVLLTIFLAIFSGQYNWLQGLIVYGFHLIGSGLAIAVGLGKVELQQ